MLSAWSAFNPEHDAAAIWWNRGTKPVDMPVPAINHALQKFYKDDSLAPYLYTVYDANDEFWIGVLIAGNFEPDNVDQIRVMWEDLINTSNAAPQSGEWEPQTWAI